MEFFDVIQARRSIRKYTSKVVPLTVIEKAIDAALLAPNSSNMQTWRIFWVREQGKKKSLVDACLSQGAATTAQELLVFVADPSQWKVTQKAILAQFGKEAPPALLSYYEKLMPFLYGWRCLALIKWFLFNSAGLFRPMTRRPWSSRDISEVCIKSAALACENFMLAISAQGFDTCPMEGFDEKRVSKLLKLNCRARVVMVISVGERAPEGVWGERYRLPKETVVCVI